MPTTQKPFIIGVKNTNLNAGEYVKVTNVTSGGTIKEAVNSSGEAAINPENHGLKWGLDDVILIESNGRIVFNYKATIGKGGVNKTSTASSADDSPAVNL